MTTKNPFKWIKSVSDEPLLEDDEYTLEGTNLQIQAHPESYYFCLQTFEDHGDDTFTIKEFGNFNNLRAAKAAGNKLACKLGLHKGVQS